MWTQFMDMHSGGGQKEKWAKIYIEAPEKEAIKIFYNRFGHNPYRVTCTCCGNDYSTSEGKTLEEVTAYERNCDYETNDGFIERQSDKKFYGEYITIEQFLKDPSYLIIYKEDIEPEEYEGSVPEQGYIWVD